MMELIVSTKIQTCPKRKSAYTWKRHATLAKKNCKVGFGLKRSSAKKIRTKMVIFRMKNFPDPNTTSCNPYFLEPISAIYLILSKPF